MSGTQTGEKLSQELVHQIMVKAMENAAKAVAKRGTGMLPAGGYPFALAVEVSGELLVGNHTPAGEPVETTDFTPGDVLRGLIETLPNAESALSDALAWHKANDRDARKAKDPEHANLLLKLARRRKMTAEHSRPARAGAVRCSPFLAVSGSVGANSIEMEIDAS